MLRRRKPSCLRIAAPALILTTLSLALPPSAVSATRTYVAVNVHCDIATFKLVGLKPATVRAARVTLGQRDARVKPAVVRRAARRGTLRLRLSTLRWTSLRTRTHKRRTAKRAGQERNTDRHRRRAGRRRRAEGHDKRARREKHRGCRNTRARQAGVRRKRPKLTVITSDPPSSLSPPPSLEPSDPTSDPSGDESKLSWAPPPLTNPITINVSDTQWLVSMDPAKDYIVRIGHQSACAPAGSNQSGLWLEGGHNVVLIGGHVSIPCESTSYGRTGIKIRNATGTVHVEGVLIDNAGGYLTDGIAIAAPQATVQLENLRVGPTWDWTTAHPDLVQVQGGVAKLRVDVLTGIPTYQGIFLKDEAGIPNGPTDLRRVNLKPISGLGVYKPNRVFWQESKDIAVTMSDFYVDRSGYQARAFKDMPNPGTDYVCCDGDTTRYATLAPDGLSMTWAGSNITGTVRDGNPPSGDFVPGGAAGEGYVSPGYR
jgi:hypothetical protein